MLRRQQNLPISTGQLDAPAANGLPARRSGLTLVEMMVAVVILAVGLLGLASTSAVVTRQVGGAASQTLAANVIQSRLEWMRAVPCATIQNKEVQTRGIKEVLVRGAEVNRILWVTDTIKYSVGGSPRTQVYTMTAQCK
jgi:prepilin-type N-terminal cleavage/methylation domain-containing protein